MDGRRPAKARPFPDSEVGHAAAVARSQQTPRRNQRSDDRRGHRTRCQEWNVRVIVSNHGARQLDQVGSTIAALPECVRAANGKFPVLVDGGSAAARMSSRLLRWVLRRWASGGPISGDWGVRTERVVRIMEILRAELAAIWEWREQGRFRRLIARSYAFVHEVRTKARVVLAAATALMCGLLAAPDDEAGKILPRPIIIPQDRPVDLVADARDR